MSGKEWGDERKLTQPTFGGVESEKGSLQLKMLVQIAGLQQQASGWEGEENDE